MAQTPLQTELQKLIGPDTGSVFPEFGSAVALSDDRALIGAPGVDSASQVDAAGEKFGAAYVYERDGTGTWVQVAELTASDASARNRFGISVALSGDRLLVGANRGGYVYERDGAGTWVEVAKLTPNASDLTGGVNSFGREVALSGDRALVRTNGGGPFLYERDGTGTWSQVANLADDAANFYSAYSVALSGDRALVGASKNANDPGAVYVYERDGTGTWGEVAELTAPDASAHFRFGVSVKLSGDRALVGASGTLGAAYVYERDGAGTWTQVAKLTASDGREDDAFGRAVALSGDRALVGDEYQDGVGRRSGAVYVYERDGAGTWAEVAKLVASDWDGNLRGRGFGSGSPSIALSGDLALVGAKLDRSDGDGAAYVFGVAAESDADEDGIVDAMDNCPGDFNPLQENFDGDLPGDACDLDDDNDGVDDTDDPDPLDPESTLPPLILGQVDSDFYGFDRTSFGSPGPREALVRQFDASGSDLLLTLTGYDIDTATEVSVRVNGVLIGFMSKTPNFGRTTTRLPIAKSLLSSTGNTLRIEPIDRYWRWGVSDLLLSERVAAGHQILCNGLPVTVDLNRGETPTSGDDVIFGTPAADTINALGGNDTVCGEGGADIINAGSGDDRVEGGPGNDVIRGGAGNDELRGQAGDDTVMGYGGADRILGGAGVDDIDGGAGNDILLPGPGATAGSGFSVKGGGGDDIVYGGPDADDIRGNSGDDRLYGRGGDDRINGGPDEDWIAGDAGDDALNGGMGDDVVRGGAGDDVVRGDLGDDAVLGGEGKDSVEGGGGDDVLVGGASSGDVCRGQAGIDTATSSCERTFGVP